MRGRGLQRAAHAAIAVATVLLTLALCACSTVNRITGKGGAITETEARNMEPKDPLARPVQVAWTSARASHCGFIFDPNQLRANYLAAEAQTGKTPAEMQKIEHAYDYTQDSVTRTIKDDPNYCTKERTAAIRRDLNRYLSGDYTPSARMGR
jgi:hypothetical protein